MNLKMYEGKNDCARKMKLNELRKVMKLVNGVQWSLFVFQNIIQAKGNLLGSSKEISAIVDFFHHFNNNEDHLRCASMSICMLSNLIMSDVYCTNIIVWTVSDTKDITVNRSFMIQKIYSFLIFFFWGNIVSKICEIRI